jgi:DNA-binding transcriptional MocR family regulator
LENGGLEQNIAKSKAVYSQRVSIMDAVLHQHIPQTDYSVPKGGYFFWIHLPNTINTMELRRKAEDFKVGFRPGALFSCQKGMQDYIRLSFVFYEPDQLEQGILRLKRSLENSEY